MHGFWQRLTRLDTWLAGLAVVGYLLFAFLLPRQHPDAAASLRLTEERARTRATAFLREKGYGTDSLYTKAVFVRDQSVLNPLQEKLGRPGLIRWIHSNQHPELSPYLWNVAFGPEKNVDYRKENYRYVVRLNMDGAVVGFDRREGRGDFSDRRALAAVGARAAGGDSLSRAVALGLARYHLSRSAARDLKLTLDSLAIMPHPGGRPTAWLRFAGDSIAAGQRQYVVVDVSATGALRTLDIALAKQQFRRGPRTAEMHAPPGAPPRPREEQEESSTASVNFSSDDALGAVSAAGYVILILFSLVLFFRRLSNRMLDMGAAYRDSLMSAGFVVVSTSLTVAYEIVRSTEQLWTGLGLGALVILAMTAGASFLVFLLSGTGDSLAREVWPHKVEALSLVRRKAFRNVPVGTALLRGIAIAGILLGTQLFTLALIPHVGLQFGGNGAFLFESIPSPFLVTIGENGYFSLFIGLLVLLVLGSFVARRRRIFPVIVPIVSVVFALLRAGSISVNQTPYEWLMGAVVGLIIGIAFWHFDLLTCAVGLFFGATLWELAPGLLVQGSPELLDAGLGLLLLAGVFAFGLIGVLRGQDRGEIEDYVPPYVLEMAQQERLKRELELAHQVQEAFLPRRMPDVEGIDLAAMCLAAQEVGGDYYDFCELGHGRLGIVIGDVSGKGIQAAFYMTLVKGIFQTLCATFTSPAEVLRRMNAIFSRNAPRGMFISMIYGVLDVEARTFTFARAGHNPVILKRSPSREAECMLPAGIAIGLTPGGRFDDTIQEITVNLNSGDVLVFYTDGFSEARNMSNDEYGDDRLARRVSTIGNRSAAEILRGISEDVHHFVESAGRHDDMTMVVIRFGHVQTDGAPLHPQKAETVS